MASIFSRIVAGEIPCYKVAENEEFLAFHDAFPLVKGHILVVPKTETDNILDLDRELYLRFFDFSRNIALAIEKAIPCKKVGIAVVGLEVPHAHIHLIPLQSMDDIDFGRPKLQLSPQEFNEVVDHIKRFL
ncbi:MAG TPA: HIT family protein [Bacteroidia bacterium]|nr:HIT family protein [Sphingobacteriales bacterium]HPD64738.1 HIT family protein [Bacteroidia bacterium]HRS59318.1 HIT family protein [Bacteroidia bacterium]HRU68258.1 HIT family protein [Bacteroidia bacterium]